MELSVLVVLLSLNVSLKAYYKKIKDNVTFNLVAMAVHYNKLIEGLT